MIPLRCFLFEKQSLSPHTALYTEYLSSSVQAPCLNISILAFMHGPIILFLCISFKVGWNPPCEICEGRDCVSYLCAVIIPHSGEWSPWHGMFLDKVAI